MQTISVKAMPMAFMHDLQQCILFCACVTTADQVHAACAEFTA